MTISDKIRVYELSRDLNLENKDILDAAQKLSISVKSHSSSISLADAKKIKNLINKKNPGEKIISVNKSSFKTKIDNQKNSENKNTNNKSLPNKSNQENSTKESLNSKPLLTRPVNKPNNALQNSNRKIENNSNKLENLKSPVIVSNPPSQTRLRTQGKNNNSGKPNINNLKERNALKTDQNNKPFKSTSTPPIKAQQENLFS